MCKNIQVSVVTFLLAAASMTYVWMKSSLPHHRYMVVWVMTFASIQLVDALLWHAVTWGRREMNHIVSTYLIVAILAAEVIVSYYAATIFLGWSNRLYEVILWIFTVLMIGEWIKDCTFTTVNGDGYLKWCNLAWSFYGRLLLFAFLFYPLLRAFPNCLLKWVIVSTGLLTFVMNFRDSAFGTKWCWSANIISIISPVVVMLESSG